MRITKQVLGRSTAFTGADNTGWFPVNAANAESTPVNDLVLDVRIVEAEGGFILAWQSRTTKEGNDSWHETIDEAIREAETQLGVRAVEWEDVNEEFEG